MPQDPAGSEAWCAGDEYDDELIDRLHAALKSLGYESAEHWGAVTGANDFAHTRFDGPRGSLTVESETYIGITVTGPAELVSALRSRLA